jgi:hypothetical protein
MRVAKLIKRGDFELRAALLPNVKGDPTLLFQSVWPTSNKQEPITHYRVTLDLVGREALRDLLKDPDHVQD